MRYCSSCGSLNDTDAKFCQNCGKHFDYDGGTPVLETPEPVIEESAPTPELVVEPVQAEEPASEPVQDAPVQPETVAAPVPNPVPHRGKAIALGIIGFILGINGLLFCWTPFCSWIFLIFAIVGLILCNKSKKLMNFRLAGAGKIISIIGIVACAIFVAFTIFLLIYFRDDLGRVFENFFEYMDNIEIQFDFY